MIPAGELANVFDNGSHFDGSAIEGFARVAESDMVLAPDKSSFGILPWTAGKDKTARLICSVHTQKRPTLHRRSAQPAGQSAWTRAPT